MINTFFKTAIAVGLLCAIILDNTLPGTKAERGLTSWNLAGGHRAMSEKAKWSYDLPFGLSCRVRPNCEAIVLMCPAVMSCSRALQTSLLH